MGRSQREKGKAGERWLAKQLRSSGYSAHRGVQHQGGPESPDVVCKDLPIHWEMKWGYKQGLSVRKVLSQAYDEAPPYSIPVGVWKPQREQAIAFMCLDDFLRLLERAYPSEDFRIREGAEVSE
jgi:hypothetical protein